VISVAVSDQSTAMRCCEKAKALGFVCALVE
jgi:hypothetical protein